MILDRVAVHAAQRPDEVAVVEIASDGTQHTASWAALLELADQWAALLLSLGVQPGEPVAYQLPNGLDFVAISLGALRIGAVCEPLMPMFRERELEFMLTRGGARVLIVPDNFRGRDHRTVAASMLTECPALERVIVLGEEPWVNVDQAALDARRPGPRQNAQLLFTSGTSGEPKGVLQRHEVLDLAAALHLRHFALGPGDVVYVPSPLAHQTGFLYGMWIALQAGLPAVVQAIWDADVGLDAMRTTGVTFVQAATPFLADLVRVAGERGASVGSLRIFVATGAAIPRELAREARDVLGAEVGGAWGTTETCLGTAFVPGEDPQLAWSSDGRPLDAVKIRIVDDDGTELAPGHEGNYEILTPTMFDGYLGRPDLTAEVLTQDGWYRTGDLARVDADGYLRITGRVKDVVNRGGEKVPVAEIEQLLYQHPAVRDIAIVAMPDPRLGERACAFVVLEPGAELEFSTMQEYLDAARVAKTYWPERLESVDSLPRTPSGKIQKYVLRDQVAALVDGKAVTR
jgi:cyclohexanecarboxylate-CoA ligase